MAAVTGCERILARLERGPATAAELYAETFTIVHSRISDLRRRGHVITCEHVAGKTGARSYLYRLQDSGTEPSGQPSSSPGQVVPPDRPADVANPLRSTSSVPVQLRLVEAA